MLVLIMIGGTITIFSILFIHYAMIALKRLFCKHENQYTITNFYGDAINYFNCRSWRKCKDCGKIIDAGLDENCDRVNQWWYTELENK